MKANGIGFVVMIGLLGAQTLYADTCGVVPPVAEGGAVAPLERVGIQKTYAFYKDGIESLVVQPGCRGEAENFGVLIPFPTPPVIRKVNNDIFTQVSAAIDPPEIVIDLTPTPGVASEEAPPATAVPAAAEAPPEDDQANASENARLLRQEPIGIYEIAVLKAGSAEALKTWMGGHGYRYPEGMDDVCEQYIADGWCFVALKTGVEATPGVVPPVGRRDADPALTEGLNFEGNVQPVAFRFRTEEFVVPMRLSAFNTGDTRNVLYVLTDRPKRINGLSRGLVVRQVPGQQIYNNLTRPLPLRVIGGEYNDIPTWRLQHLDARRNPTPYNGQALELFASDILSVQTGRLIRDVEGVQAERLTGGDNQRGGEAPDESPDEALGRIEDAALREAGEDLKGMTLTVVDGDFPREVIARSDLTFSNYKMWHWRNRPSAYDAQVYGPAPEQAGILYESGALGTYDLRHVFPALAGAILLGVAISWRRRPVGWGHFFDNPGRRDESS